MAAFFFPPFFFAAFFFAAFFAISILPCRADGAWCKQLCEASDYQPPLDRRGCMVPSSGGVKYLHLKIYAKLNHNVKIFF
ncbi:MAG: hypothetical protein HYT99_04485 [Candidatus Tectomicrobia bacterium]|nr:hypothetical protein [Candidatus Tectomicrobia bacterium]